MMRSCLNFAFCIARMGSGVWGDTNDRNLHFTNFVANISPFVRDMCVVATSVISDAS